jgi:hypothetical protein
MEDSMTNAKNNTAGVENIYLKNRRCLCKISTEEIVGISADFIIERQPIRWIDIREI